MSSDGSYWSVFLKWEGEAERQFGIYPSESYCDAFIAGFGVGFEELGCPAGTLDTLEYIRAEKVDP